MSKAGAEVRPTYLPAANFSTLEIPRSTLRQRVWYRLYWEKNPAIDFNPRAGNRFTPSDGRYEVLYLAADARTCFLEVFGDQIYQGLDIAQSRWFSRSLAEIEISAARVCDLRSKRTLSFIRTDLSSILAQDLSVPQTWAREIMAHPAGFDGLAYPSRFTKESCLAIFGRERMRRGIKERKTEKFCESGLAADLIEEFEIRLI